MGLTSGLHRKGRQVSVSRLKMEGKKRDEVTKIVSVVFFTLIFH